MERICEPELMEDPEQAQAYAQADFSQANRLFIELFARYFPEHRPKRALDLGCGPGEITLRFAQRYPGCLVTGIDGAEAMLAFARQNLKRRPELKDRVRFLKLRLPAKHPCRHYDTILSNSLLHHLHDPKLLWREIQRFGQAKAAVLVMDLERPASPQTAKNLVARYAAQAPEILRRDFFNSLCAAFTLREIQAQLQEAGLSDFKVEKVSDRHLAAYGRLP